MEIIQHIKIGAAWNLVGFSFRFVIGLASSILFVRLLGQQQYGIVTFILSCVFFSGILVNLGLGTVMTKSIVQMQMLGNMNQAVSLLKKVSLPRFGVIFILGLIFFQSERISVWIGKSYLSSYLIFVPLIVFTSYFQGTFRTMLSSTYEQKFINIIATLEMILKLGLVIASIFLGFGVIGFLMAVLLSQFVSGIPLLIRAYHRLLKRASQIPNPFRLKPHIPLAFHSFLVAISVRLLGRESDLFLLGLFHHDIRQVAIYAVVFGLPNMLFDVFRNIIGGGLGLTAFIEQVKANRLDDLRISYYTILNLFAMFLIPAIIGGMIVGGDLAVLLYGMEYKELALPMGILFLSLGFSTITTVTSDLLFSVNRERWLMLCRTGFGLLNITVNILVIPVFGALGVAISTGVASIGMTLVEMVLIHRVIKPEYPWRQMAYYFVFGCIMGGLVVWLQVAFYWKISIGIALYLLLLLLKEILIDHRKNFNTLMMVSRFKLNGSLSEEKVLEA